VGELFEELDRVRVRADVDERPNPISFGAEDIME